MVVMKKIRNKQKKKPTEKKNANKPHKSVASGSQVSKEVEKSLKKEVPRPYNSGWEKEEQFAGWLSPAPPSVLIPNRREAFCRWCQKGLRAHKADLDIHSQTIRHQQRAEELDTSKQKNLTQCGVAKKSDLPKKADIGLAIHLACHSSIRTIDHLSDLLKKLGVGSILEKLQLRRTKASKLILNVIAPAFMKELVDDIGDGCFSIIVDESTDVSCFKYMAYAIKYFGQRTQRIITNFLGFTRVGSATAKQLHLDLKEFLTDSGLDIKKMIGIGTDRASNMCGGNNSLFTLLRESQPSLQLIKCMCHSVALAISKAADELPSELENLVKGVD